jgi:Ribonuclease G/E
MDWIKILEILVPAVLAIVLGFIGYLQVIVPAREKTKADNHEQEMERLRAECQSWKEHAKAKEAEAIMWREKAHASEAQADLEREKRANIEMLHIIEMNEYRNALDALEVFNVDENVSKVIALLKDKLRKQFTPSNPE